MNPEIPDEARDLSRRLDRVLPPYTHMVNGMDSDPLIEAAQRLAQSPRPILSQAAQQRIEARLRERALALQPERSRLQKQHGLLRPLGWVWRGTLALVVIVVLLGAGAIQVSASSLPGDTLYPVKRAFEDVRLTLASTDSEPNLRLELADRRVDEFEALLKHHKVHTRVLDEANDHLDRALDLSLRGYGNRTDINQEVLRLTRRQTRLIGQAVSLASVEETQHLQMLVDRVSVIQNRVSTTTPDTNAPPVLPAHTITPLPSQTPSMTPTSTVEPSPTSTETPRPTQQPSITPPPTNTPRFTPTNAAAQSPTLTETLPTVAPIMPASTQAQNQGAVQGPTRTPPGHGPTPGLGDNPPGHGGENPGVGNNGNPPGQDNKPPKDK